jgi:hypothetical protein
MKYPAESHREDPQPTVEKYCEMIIFIKDCNTLVDSCACVILSYEIFCVTVMKRAL